MTPPNRIAIIRPQNGLQPTTAASAGLNMNRLLNTIGSLWMSATLLTLIVIYAALGSAIPMVRQYFELSEGAYFSHWVFGALVLALCLALIIATSRRVTFSWVNGGVIMVHTGILLLAGGSLQYFGGKIEGDVLLSSPTVQVFSRSRLSGNSGSAKLGQIIAAQGKVFETNMPMAGGKYRIEVASVKHDGMKTAAEVELKATFGDPPKTETIVLKQGGEQGAFKQINEHVVLALSGATKIDRFYDSVTPALEITVAGRSPASFPLTDLPRYGERFDPAVEQVADVNGQVVRSQRYRGGLLDAWSLPISVVSTETPRVESRDWPVNIEIDGYLPYADLRESLEPGGEELRPVARVDMRFKDQQQVVQLEGLRAPGSLDGWPGAAMCEFRWQIDSRLPTEWTQSLAGSHILTIEVKDKNVRQTYDIRAGQSIAVEGTEYTLKIDQLMPVWPLMTPGFENARSPVAQVTVAGNGKRYQRTVIERYPQLSQDVDEKGVRHRDGPYDPNIVMTYHDCSAQAFTLAAGPELSPVLIHTAPGGKRTLQALKPGEEYAGGDAVIKLLDVIEKPRAVMRPVVIPFVNRQRNMMQGRDMSLVRVKLETRDGKWSEHAWVPHTQYGYLGDRKPVNVAVPGVGAVELVYGRMTRPLPGDLTLEWMEVAFNPGRGMVRDWKSHIRMQEAAGAVQGGQVYLNHTWTFGPWTLFQSGAANDHESWTILGVGNRRGIVAMVLGCVLITLGLLYAFYVKPFLKQRIKAHYLAEAAAKHEHSMRTNGKPAPAMSVNSFVAALLCTGLLIGSGAASAQKPLSPDAQLPPGHPPITQAPQADAPLPAADAAPNLPAGHPPIEPAAGESANEPESNPALPAGHPPIGAMPEGVEAGESHEGHDHAAAVPESSEARRAFGEKEIESLKAIQSQLKLADFGLLTVQYANRYQTIEAWARDVVKSIHGSTALDGLDPIVGALEVVFNARAHVDRDVIFIKDFGIRNDLTAHPVMLTRAEQDRIRRTGLVSYRFIRDDSVGEVFAKLQTQTPLQRAVDRVENAVGLFESARATLRLVPDQSGAADARWHAIDDLIANTGFEAHSGMGRDEPVPGVSAEQSRSLLKSMLMLSEAWRLRDAKAINQHIGALCAALPAMAPEGVYPTLGQRKMEAFYCRMNAFTWGWGIYIVGLAMSIWAVMTRFSLARWLATAIFLVAFVLHGAGLGLRWYIVDRIPVANMFEAVVASAWLGAALALGLEWRVIRAWQTVYLAPMCVAVVLHQRYDTPLWYVFAGVAAAGLLGDMIYLAARNRGRPIEEKALAGRGVFVLAACFLGFMSLALGRVVGSEITTIAGILDDVLLRIHTVLIITSYAIVTLAYGVSNCYLVVRAVRYATPQAAVTLGCQLGTGAGLYGAFYVPWIADKDAGTIVATIVGLAMVGGVLAWALLMLLTQAGRPSLTMGVGAAGIVSQRYTAVAARLPDSPLLAGLDLSQMTLLNMANVGLFAGMILGAVWADYSWGRPWGWDPKEVFALNTWLIYAILIHVRMLSRDKALWSAVVAVIGFAMMMFNWWAVNFFIVGLHSYA